MGSLRFKASATLFAATAISGVASTPPAAATGGEHAINGTFTATSNGEWAQMNDRFQSEATVRVTWTVTSRCALPFSCAGTVTSSLGWTEDIYRKSENWYVKHYIPDWIPCPDGTRAPGLQVYRFIPSNDDGLPQQKSDVLVGEDETTGESGACGRNRSLVLSMPFKLVKIA